MQFRGFYLDMSRQDGGKQDKSEEGKWIREVCVFIYLEAETAHISHSISYSILTQHGNVPEMTHRQFQIQSPGFIVFIHQVFSETSSCN